MIRVVGHHVRPWQTLHVPELPPLPSSVPSVESRQLLCVLVAQGLPLHAPVMAVPSLLLVLLLLLVQATQHGQPSVVVAAEVQLLHLEVASALLVVALGLLEADVRLVQIHQRQQMRMFLLRHPEGRISARCLLNCLERRQ